jgi:hypothetical protein
MKNITLSLIFIFAFALSGISQTSDSLTAPKKQWKVFTELDLGLLAMSGGVGSYSGVRKGPHSLEVGFQQFKSNASLGGTPDGFDLKVDYIYSVHYSYFWNGKTDKGFFTRVMYHNKKQVVTEKSSGISKNLYSDLVGVELGYVFNLYKGLYITPRLGALYYLKSPQGKGNNPVLVGNSSYDNGRHKNWDTYFIPTISVGYSLPL